MIVAFSWHAHCLCVNTVSSLELTVGELVGGMLDWITYNSSQALFIPINLAISNEIPYSTSQHSRCGNLSLMWWNSFIEIEPAPATLAARAFVENTIWSSYELKRGIHAVILVECRYLRVYKRHYSTSHESYQWVCSSRSLRIELPSHKLASIC